MERWPVYSLWLLIGAAAINRYTIDVGALTVFPEYVALALAVAMVVGAVRGGHMAWRWPTGSWLLAAWLLIALSASAFNAPNPTRSLIQWNKLWMMAATYVVIANVSRGRLRDAVRAQLTIGIGVAIFGLMVAAVWAMWRVDLGTQEGIGGTRVSHGTLREANLLGSYLLAMTLLALPIVSDKKAFLGTWLVRLALILGIVGVGVSLTRAAWVAFAVGVAVAGVATLVRGPRISARTIAAAAATVGMLALVALLFGLHRSRGLPEYDPQRSGEFLQRVVSFGALDKDPDLWVRSAVNRQALLLWRQRPWIGWGVGSIAGMYSFPTDDRPAWISNLFIHHLFDSGVLGLGLLACAIGLIVWRGVGAWRCARDAPRRMIGGLLLALLGLLVAFQATEASWLAYPWIYLGMLEGARA